MVVRLQANRFPEEKFPCKGGTIGDLVEYLSQFPKEWDVSILSHDDVLVNDTIWVKTCRHEIVLEDHNISTLLTSRGEPVEN